MMTRLLRRAVAVMGVAGLIAFGLASPAAAAELTVSPGGPYSGGDRVTVTLSGFSPNAPIAVGIVAESRFPAEGPGDACASRLGCSALTVADAQGGVVQELTIIEGSIENSTPPVESCGPNDPCLISAANINDPNETASIEIEYAGSAEPEPEPTTTATAEPGPAEPGTDTDTDRELADTGPREIAITMAIGLLLFQVGLMFAVRAVRKTPRRVIAH